MALSLSNRASHLLILQLNSGKTLHLAPGESSRPVDDLEVSGNEKITKLLRSSLIAVTPVVQSVKITSGSALSTESPIVTTTNTSAQEAANPAESEVRPLPSVRVESGEIKPQPEPNKPSRHRR